jgi:protocatechuate 3,4-dioxygenase beta subunit
MAERNPITTRRAMLRLMGGSTALGILGCESGAAASSTGSPDAADTADNRDAIAMGDAGSAGDATVNSDLGPNEPDVPTEDWANTEWARGGTAAMVDRANYPDPHTTALPVCALIVPTTAGPCTTARQIERADLSEGAAGLPVRLSLRVVDSACAPRAGVTVAIWHAIVAGSYTGQTPNNAFCVLDAALTTSDQGRGFQVTDTNGVVAFDTCFPGWYPGRAIHFHFAVRDGDTTLGVSQLFFPEDLTSGIFASHPDYSPFGQPDTPWSRDGVIRGMPAPDRPRHTLDIARMSDGVMLASKTLVLP